MDHLVASPVFAISLLLGMLLLLEMGRRLAIRGRGKDSAKDLDAGKLLLPALNEMIDITTTREMAANLHPPAINFILLFALGLGFRCWLDTP
jgi:hypothetical protein